MANNQQPLKGMPITFEIYAHTEQEVEQLRQAVVAFIRQHAKEGRAVTAKKVAEAIPKWDSNILVKNQIIKFFSEE